MSSAIAGNLSPATSREGVTDAPSGALPISPSTAISLVALFFALGGSAFAVGHGSSAAQPRCATGAVRGIATVTGEPSAGIANVGDQFTSRKALFSRRFNCTGGARPGATHGSGCLRGAFRRERRPRRLAASVGDAYADVEPVGGGVFRVSIHPAGRDDLSDRTFTIVVV